MLRHWPILAVAIRRERILVMMMILATGGGAICRRHAWICYVGTSASSLIEVLLIGHRSARTSAGRLLLLRMWMRLNSAVDVRWRFWRALLAPVLVRRGQRRTANVSTRHGKHHF